MNFQQKFGLIILSIISVLFVYFSFWGQNLNMPSFNFSNKEHSANPTEKTITNENELTKQEQVVKIFILDKNGTIRSVNRTCDNSIHTSCLEFAISELLKAPSQWEKTKDFYSEIPQGTKIISLRENGQNILLDLSGTFEKDGGTESIYIRLKQLIKTVRANTKLPVYLYINGKQANVIGGEGLMIKQPLNERSIDE